MASSIGFTSLSAVTTGTGSVVNFGQPISGITAAIIVNGTVAAGVATLDVSHDGVNFVPLLNSTTLATGVNQRLTAGAEAWQYARARVSTTITGGGTITCTVNGAAV
jgi:hypothetical protein